MRIQKPSKRLVSINPATGQELASFEALTEPEIAARVKRAAEAQRAYRRTSFAERARILGGAAGILESEKERWARLLSLEMGKTLKAALDEVLKCARTCRFYAEQGERMLAPRNVRTEADESYVRFEPLGTVLAIMPWNFPFWQVFRFAAPALMAGNAALLKHASNVPQSALAIEEIFRRAGLPEGVFQTLLIGASQVGQLLEDDRIAAVTLTGSDDTGSKVAATAGHHLKKTVLELGGSDPFIVMPSADLEEVVRSAATARMLNNGQSCVAAKRFIVHEGVYDEFERRFAERLAALRVGDPLDPSTELGPLATREVLDTLVRQVDESVRAGARALTGGHRIDGPGNFYAPTLLASIPEEAPAYRDEVFGPVALLFRVSSLDDALRLANDSRYGLGASLWSQDREEQRRFVEEIESGMAFVNSIVASDPRLPFGGVKRSGYGRELSHFGIEEFTNVKTVSIRRGQAAASERSGAE